MQQQQQEQQQQQQDENYQETERLAERLRKQREIEAALAANKGGQPPE